MAKQLKLSGFSWMHSPVLDVNSIVRLVFSITSCGFTLVELLVVIAIISLLLAIMMPGLKKAKLMA